MRTNRGVNMGKEENIINKVKFNDKGLIPAVLQDCESGEVLMVAYMNETALKKSLQTEKAYFWSRSRQKLWLKGETSGNYQLIEEIKIDCDSDTLLIKVKPQGPACHTGHKSCFYRVIEGNEIREKESESFNDKTQFLQTLTDIIYSRKENLPEDSYTSYLFTEGIDKICKKIGEEATEVVIAAKNEVEDEIIYESADLIYHLLVILTLYDITPGKVIAELEQRHK